MILEKLHLKDGFTENEKIIAEYILKHPEEFQNMKSEELAAAAYTSKSSVIRLCKKLKVSGFQEMKKLLFSEFNEERLLGKEDSLPIINEKSHYSEYQKALTADYKRVIEETERGLNHNVLRRVANRMAHIEKIDFYATGLAYALSESASHKYNTLGFEASVNSNLNESYIISSKSKSKTIAFVVSFSGNNPFIIRTAEILKKHGLYVVGITGPLSEEIEKYCDEIIPIFKTSPISGMETVFACLSFNYVFDIFYVSLLSRNYEKQIEMLKKITYDYSKTTIDT